MKTDTDNKNPQAGSAHFWQTLEERTRAPQESWNTPEFETSINEMAAERKNFSVNRRNFLKFMGAGAVMVGAACRRPTEQIVPAVLQPTEYLPGLPLNYASVAPDGTGILVRTREGRPVKIAGNKQHPLTKGAVSAWNAASTMDLYDPDRLRKPFKFDLMKSGKRRKRVVPEAVILDEAARELKKGAYVILSAPIQSPSTRKLVQKFLSNYPGGKLVELRQDPVLRQIAEGQNASYGTAVVPNYRFNKADYILSIDGDFLGTMVFPSHHSATFGESRSLKNGRNKMSRLVSFESMYSLTGSNADDRYSIRPGDQVIVALALAAEIAVNQKKSNVAGNSAITTLLDAYRPAKVAATLNHSEGTFKKGDFEKTIEKIGAELWANKGKSIVVGGSPLNSDGKGVALQIAINLLNSMLENDGKTVDHKASIEYAPGAEDSEVQQLLSDIGRGKIKSVILAGANPVYHLPAAMKVDETLKKAGYVLSLNDRIDESASFAHAALPTSHYLESWGDSEAVKGVFAIAQPTIRPIYKSRSFEDRLIQLAGGSLGGAGSFFAFLKSEWSGRGDWVKLLQDGYYTKADLDGNRNSRSFKTGAISDLPSSIDGAKIGIKGLKLGTYYNSQVLDGTGGNNAYRQELPEPVTKVVWENYVSILPSTARKLGFKQGSIVKAKVGGQSIELPVHMQPGLHPGAAFIALGYGRKAAGLTGNDAGKNALDLVLSPARGKEIVFSGQTIELSATGVQHQLPNTQKVYRNGFNTEDKAFFAPKSQPGAPYGSSSHYVGVKPGEEHLEKNKTKGRPVVREMTFANYKKGAFKEIYPQAVHYVQKDVMTSWKYTSHRWHMSIDLNSCIGCSSCVTSCNIENNIPMVGPEEVSIGREMHWLRIDRYYKGTEERPEVIHQPMMCQHCENAPCENVCPVTATTHNHEGLNVMTYNRCIGTRYCMNNCPYKVRRFNWFENWNYMEGLERKLREPQHLGLNPNVTVRPRGTMEKCSFCVQRIEVARHDIKHKGKKARIEDGVVQTACQEVCPTHAITFGDINNDKSEVHKLVKTDGSKAKRGFEVLDFLGVKPQVTYLAKVRNKA